MKQSLIIFRHYLLRALLDPVGTMILTGLPIVIIIILSMVFSENIGESEIMVYGYNMASTQVAISLLLMFQFFGGSIMLDWLYADFKSAKRWRLFTAPCRQNTFILSAGAASWVFSLIQGVLIITASTLFFDAYFGNFIVLALVLLIVSIMGQFIFMLLFYVTKKKGTAEGLAQIIIQGMMLLSVWIVNFEIPDNKIVDFFIDYGTPIALAKRAINYSGFIGNDMMVAAQALGILAGITALLAGIVILIGRRRPL